MKLLFQSIVVLLVFAGAGGAFYLWKSSKHDEAPPAPVTQSRPIAQGVPSPSGTAPSYQYPIPTENAKSEVARVQKPVPALDESDRTIAEALSELIGEERFKSLFHLQDIARRIVVTVDNISVRKQPSEEFVPIKQPDGEFAVTGKRNQKESTISSANFQRYQPYVDLAEAVDPHKLVQLYIHFYPLFQAAFVDLGTKGYFNDRLIQAIDHLLETPDVAGPIRVTRPSIRYKYKFVDDRLENLSAAQKLLVRMGQKNAGIIKLKLRKIRILLVEKN